MISASEFRAQVPLLQPKRREALIRELLLAGNTPLNAWGYLQFFYLGMSKDLAKHSVGITVATDYLMLGMDDDYLRIPVRAATAQAVATQRGCILPTRFLVDQIWKGAIHLEPQPMTPGPWMASTAYYVRHNDKINDQLVKIGRDPKHDLLAGHKKDIIISPARLEGKIAIYGWHQLNGRPIQSRYVHHDLDWVDYSHGLRLVKDVCTVDGVTSSIRELLADANFHSLVSDEGQIRDTRYPT